MAVEGKLTKGRQKIEIKRIEDDDDRLITFSKRRSGIYKKASELITLCGAEIGIVVFSPAGRPFSFGHPSIESVINRYLNLDSPPNDNTHPLVEAHRRVRIHEHNQQHNELVSQLEAEKEHGKLLKQLKKASQGQDWWDAPMEELGLHELENMNASMEQLHKNLCNHINNKLAIGASSSSALPAVLHPSQVTNYPFVANTNGTKTFSIPHGYGFEHGFI